MIIWLASYPKSGNTYVRSFLSAYYFTKNGEFDFELLKFIEQFPDKQFFNGFIKTKKEASEKWLSIQRELVKSKKIKFLKTHSAYGSYNNNPFTSSEVSIGSIYIVRDPRNIISSLMNHFSLKKKDAVGMLFDENRGIKSEDNNFATYTFLSSWSNHFKSWANIKSFKTIIIKYEDLQNNNEKVFIDLIKFINGLLNNNQGIDYQKFKKALDTTNFDFLKKKESEEGFLEAIFSKERGKKIPFFNLGFKNSWKNLLDKKTIEKIEFKFQKEMKSMKYL
tara:strand:+ start:1532 stop:2365 length:834 start_codon:yes stop_codon:yes gene_type:complete